MDYQDKFYPNPVSNVLAHPNTPIAGKEQLVPQIQSD